MAAFVVAMLGALPAAAKEKTPFDPGPEPTWEDFQPLAETAIRDQMLDGESARFKWWPAHLVPLKKNKGWIACGEVNGKNSYGGYTGFANMAVYYSQGAVTKVWISSAGGVQISPKACFAKMAHSQ